MSPREQLNHIDEGDFEWCGTCNGEGVLHDDSPFPPCRCHACDGEGIVHCEDADKAGSQPVKRRAA